jgi:Tfp pilus assembly protein PilF
VRADSLFSKRVLVACLILIAATVIVYAPVRHFGFVRWDDPDYVTDNVPVARGLTWQGAAWAFTSAHAANWHPVTWLSYMLDVQLHGMNAGPQHVTNLVLHVLNAVLLFGVLYRMTAAWGRSLFVAGLFAVHPLHVESVAWISERKDVLSTLFWMLTMWAYVIYVRRPGWRRYLPVAALFALGLMAKSMLVTLPFVLLLLDFWPLRRAGWVRLVREKLPLFVLAALSSVVTFVVQRHVGAVAGFERFPLVLRLTNALASYLGYIGKMLWPARLAAFYPLSVRIPVLQASLGALLLTAVTIVAIRAGRRHGYFLVGWLWYVGTLIPVIGLVQVGRQSMADRYTYVPLIGLFLIAAWGAPELVGRWRYGRIALPAAAACVLLACAVLARAQVGNWSDSASLWQHALEVTEDNYVAHNNFGAVLLKQGETGEALPHIVEALRIKPDFADAHNNLGMVQVQQGKLDEAIPHFIKALRIDPDFAEAQYNLGTILVRQGKLDEAAQRFAEAVRIKPDFMEAQNNLGGVLMRQGKLDEAVQRLAEALRINPDSVEVRNNLRRAQAARQGKDGRQ